MTVSASDATLLRTPLYDFHLAAGARMVPFAGYDMPVQYPAGLMREHQHTRAEASLFDCSHMGQILVRPRDGDPARAARALESLIPIDILGLKPGRQRYGFFTTPEGGLSDDLMVANLGDAYLLVVNASRKVEDRHHLEQEIGGAVEIEVLDKALLALQGPKAEAALAALYPACADMRFLDVLQVGDIVFSRSGYTGEDGFEISVAPDKAVAFAEALLAQPDVRPAGLGARDTLRLESGLCLYESDIDTTTSPVEAGLAWAISPARREGGARAGGFPGADRILRELRDGPSRRRVGLRGLDRTPVRAGAPLFGAETGGEPLGLVTSGGFGPSLQAPIAMAYLPIGWDAPETKVYAEVRGRRVPLVATSLPFITPRVRRA